MSTTDETETRAGAAPVTLHICITCRREGETDEAPRAGARLHAALAGSPGMEGVRIVGVECLSNCRRGCTLAVSGPGRWTYVYGDLDPEASVAAVLDGIGRYAATVDGLVPWRERPEIFRRGVIARVPAVG